MKKKKILVIIIILIILITVGVFAYISTDILKSPKKLFKKYIFNNVTQVSEFNFKPYDEIINKINNQLAQMQINLDLDDSTRMNTTIKLDKPNQIGSTDISVMQNENSIFDITATANTDILGIKIPDLSKKYISIENRDLKKVAKTLNLSEEIINEIPDSIPKIKSFSQEENKKLKKVFGKTVNNIFTKINNNNFSVEKGVAIASNPENVTTNKYTLTINSQQLKTILKEAIDELYNNQDFQKILSERIEKSLLENYKNKITELINSIDDNELKISVYEKNSKALKTEIIYSEENISFEIKNNENKLYINEINNEYSSSFIISNKFENNKGELSLENSVRYNDGSMEYLNNNNNNNVSIISTQNGDNFTIKLTDKNNENAKEDLEVAIKFPPSLDIERVSSTNSYIINDFVEEDFQDLTTELIKNALETAEEKPYSLIGILSGVINNGEDINLFSDETETSDNNLEIKDKISEEVNKGVNKCFTKYKMQLNIDENAIIDDFLTVENIQDYCEYNHKLELVSGTTLKCTVDNNDEYYIVLDIDFDNLNLNNLEVYTAEEYENL